MFSVLLAFLRPYRVSQTHRSSVADLPAPFWNLLKIKKKVLPSIGDSSSLAWEQWSDRAFGGCLISFIRKKTKNRSEVRYVPKLRGRWLRFTWKALDISVLCADSPGSSLLKCAAESWRRQRHNFLFFFFSPHKLGKLRRQMQRSLNF